MASYFRLVSELRAGVPVDCETPFGVDIVFRSVVAVTAGVETEFPGSLVSQTGVWETGLNGKMKHEIRTPSRLLVPKLQVWEREDR